MAQLTKEQIRVYLAAEGTRCPFCGSDQIEGGAIDVDAGGASQNVTCTTCNMKWCDHYTITGITERE